MSERTESYVGSQFGSYRLKQLIGRGGFADVYLGEHIYLHTEAAVKIMRVNLAHDSLEDFLKEARTVATLDHPHIVRLLECSVEPQLQVPFLVMGYAPNGSLRQRFPRFTCLDPAQLLPIVQQMASALTYAHQHKLIHRDVKPENMLLGQHDEVLLTDFGLVIVAQTSHSQTLQEMAGTVPYMAPEQLQGHPRQASDQYALGIVTYELICGVRPFQGSFVEVASQHVLAAPPPLRARIADLPLAVETVVCKALAKNPEERFPNVDAFAHALTLAYQQQDAATIYTLEATASSLSVPTVLNTPVLDSVPPVPSYSVEPPILIPPTTPLRLTPVSQNAPLILSNAAPTLYTPTPPALNSSASAWNIYTTQSQPTISGAYTPSAPSASAPQPVFATFAASSPPLTTPPIQPLRPRRDTRRISLLVALCCLLVVLIVLTPFVGSILFPHGIGSSMAETSSSPTQPASNTGKQPAQPTQAATSTATTSAITTTQTRQVSATETVTKAFQATGTAGQALSAIGTLTFTNHTMQIFTIPAGTLCTDGQGQQFATDADAVFQGNNPGETASVHAHAVNPGAQGNVPAGTITTIVLPKNLPVNNQITQNAGNTQKSDSTPVATVTAIPTSQATATTAADVSVINHKAFKGGQDAQHTPVITQSDMDNAAAAVDNDARQAALQDLKHEQLHHEHVVGQAACSSQHRSDHNVGDSTTVFQVTVQATCNETLSN